MAAVPVLFVALAIGAIQITAIEVPVGTIKIPAASIRVGYRAELPSANERQAKSGPVPTEPSGAASVPSGDFHWSAVMHEHQMVEVRIARGSIRVLPSGDDTVRVQAHTDDPGKSGIQVVSTASGVKFCSVVTTVRGLHNSRDRGPHPSRDQEDEIRTDFVISVPAGLHFSGSTRLGDVTAEHPNADIDMATIDGNVTLQLAAQESANFSGNVINGSIDSDFPLEDNTPSLPPGVKPASHAARIVHAIVGAGGPRLAAVVVNGNIRLLRLQTESRVERRNSQ